eukprot:TRINITY_DN62121_c0_g1_i1.p1 TRINITY_DN62121_c0_g1~~TRINITY_DN62121_c0_g1_i1.p1  ORF type:complete len:1139 (+),score=294.47 TRINITY_DN62121_c0_g1_i1:76-3492(+)
MGDTAELESELIKRNREIAKVRDDVLKVERRLEESQMRNDDLLEKVAELDMEVTKRSSRIAELETKFEQMTEALDSKTSEIDQLKAEHSGVLEHFSKGDADKAVELARERESQATLQSELAKLHELAETLKTELDEEQRKHNLVRASLDQSEQASKDYAGKSVDQRRRIKELEDLVEEQRAKMTVLDEEHVVKAEQQMQTADRDRAELEAELHRATAALAEHRDAHSDLAGQAGIQEKRQQDLMAEVEELRREVDEHSEHRSLLQIERDEIHRTHEEHKAKQEDILRASRKQQQEHLAKVTQNASLLDGRLQGQRMMLEEATQALQKSELEEERLSAELRAKDDELRSEQEKSLKAFEAAKDEASREAGSLKDRFLSEMESAEVLARRHARSEVDEHVRSLADAEERESHLEKKIAALVSDMEDAKSHHSRMHETLRGQHEGTRGKLGEAEERCLTLQQQVELQKKDLEQAGLDAERMELAHRLEVERFQQTLEAEGQARNSSDQIGQSKLEEKDTLLEHAKATRERLERDLEDHQRKIAEKDAALEKAKTDFDQRTHQLNVRIASLEGTVRQRQERVTEVEGRLEAHRQHMEQLNEILAETQNDRNTLMDAKRSLESQLKLEASHKDAVNESLHISQEESARRVKELEERILRDRETHQDAIDEVRRSVSEELKQGSERLAAVEAELLSARQRCEHLMRNKAEMQKDIAEHKEKHVVLEGSVQEHRADNERLSLETAQLKQIKQSLEDDVARLQQERRENDSQIVELKEQLRVAEEVRFEQSNDFNRKVQRLDEMLDNERSHRASLEKALVTARQEHTDKHSQTEAEKRRAEMDLASQIEKWRTQAEHTQQELDRVLERIEAQRIQAETQDAQRRDMEASLRGENATLEAKLRRFEAEVHRTQTAVDEGKAKLAQHQTTSTAKIAVLERQLEKESTEKKEAVSAREAADKEMQRTEENRLEMRERLVMSAEELAARQVEFMLHRQRLSGSLEESRRTLRASLGVPTTVVDTTRIQGLETQLKEERRKAIEQAVALQRAERKSTQAEDSLKRSEDQRLDAATRARDAERRAIALTEDVRKGRVKQAATEQQLNETRESVEMAAAEMGTIKYENMYEIVRLRGSLDELRYMIRMQRPGS